MIFRLLAIAMWLAASLGAHAESSWAHALADAVPTSQSACALTGDGDPDTHCASACLATAGVAVRTADTIAPPARSDSAPHPILLSITIAQVPFVLPPSRAGPWRDEQPVPSAHLRDLAGIRLLI